MSHKYHHGSSHHRRKKPKKKRSVWRLIKHLFILGVIGFIALTLWIVSISRNLPDPTKLNERQVGQTTKIYDRTGETLLFDIFNEQKRTLVELDDIPEYAVQATLAIEDKNFYEHKGVAYKSIARAAVSNILGRRAGRGGASTLTQQLIKNAIVGDDHSYIRKIKEAILATQLEKKYTKDEILQLYLNEIPYGSTNYGIEAASQSYFGKSVGDISLSEAATLAALPQSPTRYLNNFERLQERRDHVLDVMAELNHISQAEADLAKEDDINIQKRIDNSIKAPHFVMMVKEQLSESLGERIIETGGLKITTTLDYDLQKIAEEEIAKGVEYNRENYEAENAALVAIDVETGEIRSMVGSRNFFDEEYDGQFNVATSPRQPGSSFKPLVYLTGITRGYTPNTILYDVETEFANSGEDAYAPKNYDLKERGPVTIRKALQGSLNIPAVKMIYLAGVANVLDFADGLGYTTLSDRSRFGLSLVLGGGEVTLLEHTNAFATFAREGKHLPHVSVLKVEDADGTVLFEHKPEREKEIIDRNAVLWLTDMLKDNNARAYAFGANSVLQLGERPVAAKTGTTNDYRDGWLMGYTPSLAAGVWAGNNNNTPMRDAGGSRAAGPIWQAFMQRALSGTPIEQFEKPEPIETEKPVLAGQDPGLQEMEIDTISGKLATEFTPDETRETRKFFAGHSILYHVDKNNPQGDPPANPDSDPQFKAWEDAIIEWAGKEDEEEGKLPLEISEPPTEYDDIHLPELKPVIALLEPAGQTTVGRTLTVRTEAQAPQGIDRVRFFVDDIQLAETTTGGPEYQATLNLSQFVTGFHTLEVRAYDKDFNVGKASTQLNITGASATPTALWTYPPKNSILTLLEFPVTFQFRPTQHTRVNKITLHRRHTSETFKEDIKTFEGEDITSNMTYTWEKIPEKAGSYEFSITITYDDELTAKSEKLPIFVSK